jgi:cystathionine gamma-synthase/methionine-gamma-lyase
MPPQQSNPWQLATNLVHAGEHNPAPQATPTTTPIYTSATYIYPNLAALDQAFEQGNGYVYTRYGNPTVSALEQALAAIESASGAVVYGSGMAALHGALLAAGTPRGSTAPQPRSILMSADLYASSSRLVYELFGARGVAIATCPMSDLAAVDQALATHQPDVVLVEQLSNPLLNVVDIAALAQRCRANQARLVVDNTIATPLLQRPLTLGADLVVHSATKYLGGHGDVAGGVVAARTTLMRDTLIQQNRLIGANLGPFEAQQILRGIKTLALRVERQCQNALQIAEWLATHPGVAQVRYPGLPSHPHHELARQAFGGLFGAMVTFDLNDGSRERLTSFFDSLKLMLPTTSLGDIYTLITAPAITSHRELSPAERAARGIHDGTIRLSVGIEAVQDLIADLAQALR